MAQLLLPVMECGASAWLAGSASDDREDDEDIDGEKLVVAMGNARNMMCNCQVRGTRIRASCLVRGKLVTRTLIKMRIDKYVNGSFSNGIGVNQLQLPKCLEADFLTNAKKNTVHIYSGRNAHCMIIGR